MADFLESTDSTEDTDRVLDANGFLNKQFDIFVHDYREYSDAQACKCDSENEDAECSSSAETDGPQRRKHLINTMRKVQKGLFYLQSLPQKEVFKDLQAELAGILHVLSSKMRLDKQEFAPSTVPLPQYDTMDMEMFLGEKISQEVGPLEALKAEKEKEGERLEGLLVQAEILLREVDHIKEQIKK